MHLLKINTYFSKNTLLLFNFKKTFFGPLTSEKVSSHYNHVFQILSAACRKAINRQWHKAQTPTVNEWLDIVDEIFMMERITFNLTLERLCSAKNRDAAECFCD